MLSLGPRIAVALPVVRLLPLVVLLFLRWLPGCCVQFTNFDDGVSLQCLGIHSL